jgi:hypothetical protein
MTEPTRQQAMRERLRAEAQTPYKGLRKTFYVVFAASALVGSFIFSLKLIAGDSLETTLPNLGLQLGVLALMVWLFTREKP